MTCAVLICVSSYLLSRVVFFFLSLGFVKESGANEVDEEKYTASTEEPTVVACMETNIGGRSRS